ncbi:hypothetical protein NUW58_g8211 [Xylaria curta]|uniref:Uncharacterized protein n=1 Tax=Xylaria curta TaxID=42375 RepID=A0ACC1N9L6_9PEZI|nr:hypothetical protein NUW58_g8211 [Xylaria curta]
MQGDIPLREPVHKLQPADEWRVEQGIAGGELYLLDQTSRGRGGHVGVPVSEKPTTTHIERRRDDELAKDELPGWSGYVEWEDYPEKKQKAYEIMISQEFPPPPEFQLEQIPGTNPVYAGRNGIVQVSDLASFLFGLRREQAPFPST